MAATAQAKKTAPARKGTAKAAAPAEPTALKYTFEMAGAKLKATPNYLKAVEAFSPGAASLTGYVPTSDLDGANLDPAKVKVRVILEVIPV